MLRIALPIAAFAAVLCADVAPSFAQTYGNAPWCAVVEIGSGEVERDCEYFSVAECAPNVIAGNRGFCQPNPYYRPELPRDPHHRHYRRYHRPNS